MKKLILVTMAVVMLLLTACTTGTTAETELQTPAWQEIDATTARNMMNELDDFILLDVRRADEFEEERIEGAILIPYDEIGERYSELGSKNTVILIYCRSGRRSKYAAEELAELGFINIYEFGGILYWPYETISG